MNKDIQDKLSLWMLRILIDLNGHREFIDKDNEVGNNSIAEFLG